MNIVPAIIDSVDSKPETFESYLKRWPEQLANFPSEVIEQWCFEHNGDVIEHWDELINEEWVFSLVNYPVSKIQTINHLDGRMREIEERGMINLRHPHGGELAKYMLLHRTFPAPIIVAKECSHIQHPRGIPGETMKIPSQLIEGERRLGYLKALISIGYEIPSAHRVYEFCIP